jgi:hypothetical protein
MDGMLAAKARWNTHTFARMMPTITATNLLLDHIMPLQKTSIVMMAAWTKS